jgi:hypothetical protein
MSPRLSPCAAAGSSVPSRFLSRRAGRRLAVSLGLLTLGFLALGASACGSLRTLPASRRAVVVHAPGRETDADLAAALLAKDGWAVERAPTGPADRTRSSLAVYDGRKFPKMAEHLADLLKPTGEFDVLPFLQPGPGGTSAVLWLE